MHFRILKMIATSGCFLAALECTKEPPDPAGGAYSAPPDPLAGFKGPTSKGGKGRGRKEKERGGKGGERKGKKREKGGKGREGEEGDAPQRQFLDPSLVVSRLYSSGYV